MRIAFLCSGNGGNLRFIDRAIRLGWCNSAQICAVLSDRECGANTFARARGLPAEVMDFSAPAQPAVTRRLQAISPDVIVTTVHRILAPELVAAFRGKLVNLHYSMLPAFAGAIGDKPVRRALDYGAKFVGITVHHVDEQLDTGRPIIQALTATPSVPELESLMELLFRCGCVGLLNAVASYAPDFSAWRAQACESTVLAGRTVYFSPAAFVHPSLAQEVGWAFLK